MRSTSAYSATGAKTPIRQDVKKSSPSIPSEAINIDSAERALEVVTIRCVGGWRGRGGRREGRRGEGVRH